MGTLSGLRIVELAGLGPGTFASTLLADMGAEVVRIERPSTRADRESSAAPPPGSVQLRGRRSICIDLKQRRGLEILLDLVDKADVLIEGFRPGVAERLGFSPTVCLSRNPRLIYARATGWGQDGPLARSAGHDITYLALSGALYTMGPPDGPPSPPLNYLGDYGGGLHLAFGISSALVERARSGEGQMIDGAMIDMLGLITIRVHADRALGTWGDARGSNMFDGGAPFYGVYETSDAQFMAVGAIESDFYVELLAGLELDPHEMPEQMDTGSWPTMREIFRVRFSRRTRREWSVRFAQRDACVVPVLSPAEAIEHAHNQARGTFMEKWGVLQPSPSPRFSRTPGVLNRPPARRGEHTREVLEEVGVPPEELARLLGGGVVE